MTQIKQGYTKTVQTLQTIKRVERLQVK